MAAESDVANGKVYNLGSSEVVNLRDLAEMMVRMRSGSSYDLVPFPPDRKAIDIGDYYSDFSLIRHELGWAPKVSLAAGLKQTIDFYSEHARNYWD